MSDQHNTITEDLVFRDSAAVAAMGRVSGKIGALSRLTGSLKQGLANAFSERLAIGALTNISASIAGISTLYEKVSRLKAVTGVAAGTAHQLLDAFDMTGASEIAESTITKLTRMSERSRGATKEAAKLRAQLARVGVTLDKGPTTALLSMSKAAQAGRVGVNSLATTFKIPVAQAAVLMRTLQTGPERLREIMKNTAGGADLVDDAALESFENMKRARLEMADAWEGLVGTLYKQLLPGATKLVRSLTTGFEKLAPVTESIGKFLSAHMNEVALAAKAYLGYMVAAKAVETATGGKHSLIDIAGAFGKGGRAGLMKLLRGEAAEAAGGAAKKAAVSGATSSAAAGLSPLAAQKAKALEDRLANIAKSTKLMWNPAAIDARARTAAARSAAGRAAAMISPIRQQGSASALRSMALIAPGKMPGGGGVLAVITRMLPGFTRFLPVLRVFGLVLSRFLIVGAVLAFAVKMVQMLAKDVGGYRTRITALLKEIGAKLPPLLTAMGPVLDKISNAFGKSMEMNIRLILFMIEESLKVWNRVFAGLKWMGEKMDAGGVGGSILKVAAGPLGSWIAQSMARSHKLGEAYAADGKGGGPPGAKDEPPPLYDFRGSHITIENQFAQGFDIGRVSVAITDGIARASQRRVQSGFAPATAIRGRG